MAQNSQLRTRRENEVIKFKRDAAVALAAAIAIHTVMVAESKHIVTHACSGEQRKKLFSDKGRRFRRRVFGSVKNDGFIAKFVPQKNPSSSRVVMMSSAGEGGGGGCWPPRSGGKQY